MKETVNLDGKDVRAIIAKHLGIPIDRVIPMRYNFTIVGMTAAEISRKIYGEAEESEE